MTFRYIREIWRRSSRQNVGKNCQREVTADIRDTGTHRDRRRSSRRRYAENNEANPARFYSDLHGYIYVPGHVRCLSVATPGDCPNRVPMWPSSVILLRSFPSAKRKDSCNVTNCVYRYFVCTSAAPFRVSEKLTHFSRKVHLFAAKIAR